MIQRSLKPGAPGTKKLVDKYGDRLVCVRYKYDQTRGIKQKTVELIEVEESWTKQNRIPLNKKLLLRIEYHEPHLQHIVREAGGTWVKEKVRWQLPYSVIRALGLEARIEWPDV